MQNYTTILGVIRMKTNGSSMRECQRRYNIGSSTCQLILKRYKESNLSLIDLESMEPQKLMDVSKLTKTGWTSQIGLKEGLEKTYRYFLDVVLPSEK